MTVPWEDGAPKAAALEEQAQQASQAGDFVEGAALSRQAYDLEPTATAAARFIHCSRKQGLHGARAAVVFGREPVERWPAHQWLVREYVWAVYDGYLKRPGPDHAEEEAAPVDGDAEFPVMVKAARRILKLTQESLPRVRAVFALCREAKRRGQWPIVLEFAMTLDREKLSDEPSMFEGVELPSQRQQWLYHVTRANLELEQYDACLAFAREGMERYPDSPFFPWWHAVARVRRGEAAEGLAELERVEGQFPARWYVRRDVADACERLGNDDAAWHWYCRAAELFGEPRGEASLLPRMATLLERQGRIDLALDHLLLAWAITARASGRASTAENCREQIAAFVERHVEALPEAGATDTPPALQPLLERCRDLWAETARASRG